MTDRMIPVPESLIVGLLDDFGNRRARAVGQARALLSQPTPTAEATVRAAVERADLVLGGFVQHDWTSSTSVHEWYRNELRALRDAFNPSTIRDVTPPKGADG
ncbi:hypothetical protein [Curtobacterium sp. Curtsp57]|uniref:hypothetical protein n=1 Tax=Curtobacterium sp. Curtsp57 TaxID=3243047 RepID=UPI0039B4CB88